MRGWDSPHKFCFVERKDTGEFEISFRGKLSENHSIETKTIKIIPSRAADKKQSLSEWPNLPLGSGGAVPGLKDNRKQ